MQADRRDALGMQAQLTRGAGKLDQIKRRRPAFGPLSGLVLDVPAVVPNQVYAASQGLQPARVLHPIAEDQYPVLSYFVPEGDQ